MARWWTHAGARWNVLAGACGAALLGGCSREDVRAVPFEWRDSVDRVGVRPRWFLSHLDARLGAWPAFAGNGIELGAGRFLTAAHVARTGLVSVDDGPPGVVRLVASGTSPEEAARTWARDWAVVEAMTPAAGWGVAPTPVEPEAVVEPGEWLALVGYWTSDPASVDGPEDLPRVAMMGRVVRRPWWAAATAASQVFWYELPGVYRDLGGLSGAPLVRLHADGSATIVGMHSGTIELGPLASLGGRVYVARLIPREVGPFLSGPADERPTPPMD